MQRSISSLIIECTEQQLPQIGQEQAADPRPPVSYLEALEQLRLAFKPVAQVLHAKQQASNPELAERLQVCPVRRCHNLVLASRGERGTIEAIALGQSRTGRLKMFGEKVGIGETLHKNVERILEEVYGVNPPTFDIERLSIITDGGLEHFQFCKDVSLVFMAANALESGWVLKQTQGQFNQYVEALDRGRLRDHAFDQICIQDHWRRKNTGLPCTDMTGLFKRVLLAPIGAALPRQRADIAYTKTRLSKAELDLARARFANAPVCICPGIIERVEAVFRDLAKRLDETQVDNYDPLVIRETCLQLVNVAAARIFAGGLEHGAILSVKPAQVVKVNGQILPSELTHAQLSAIQFGVEANEVTVAITDARVVEDGHVYNLTTRIDAD